jgi:hypothetical protein
MEDLHVAEVRTVNGEEVSSRCFRPWLS